MNPFDKQVSWTALPSPILVIGAAHAGKSKFAQGLLLEDKEATVVGTADSSEPAFHQRLTELRSGRPKHWTHYEVSPADSHDLPRNLGKILATSSQVLVDSVNQWVAAMLVTDIGRYDMAQMETRLDTEFYTFLETIARPRPNRLVLVTSETGAGTVPPAAVERLFRQSTGRINCQLAEACATVIFMSAGIPLIMKSTPRP